MIVLYNGRWELLTTMAPILKQNGVDASTLPHMNGVFNLVALIAILVITTILVIGIKESANFNSAIVIIKVAIVLIFIGIAGSFVLKHPALAAHNWHPFIPPNQGGLAYMGGRVSPERRESSSSPTSDSTPFRPPRRKQRIRSGICRSAFWVRW